jgi:hypothetical protein
MRITRLKARGLPKKHAPTCMTLKPEAEREHWFCDCNAHTNTKRFERTAKRAKPSSCRRARS